MSDTTYKLLCLVEGESPLFYRCIIDYIHRRVAKNNLKKGVTTLFKGLMSVLLARTTSNPECLLGSARR
jgi:hypothetical protein